MSQPRPLGSSPLDIVRRVSRLPRQVVCVHAARGGDDPDVAEVVHQLDEGIREPLQQTLFDRGGSTPVRRTHDRYGADEVIWQLGE